MTQDAHTTNGQTDELLLDASMEESNQGLRGLAKRAFAAAGNAWKAIETGATAFFANNWTQRVIAVGIALPSATHAKENFVNLAQNFAAADASNLIGTAGALATGYFAYRTSRFGLPHMLVPNRS